MTDFMRRRVAGVLVYGALLVMIGAPASAQVPGAQPDPALQKMAPFQRLVGEWEGTAWIDYAPGQRMQMRSHESVQSRLDGRVVVVEGRHTGSIPGVGEAVVLHHALGVLSYHAPADEYRFHTYVADRMSGGSTHRVWPTADGFEWGYTDPRMGEVRYTVNVDATQWTETGRRRGADGEWVEFFGMKLTRKQ